MLLRALQSIENSIMDIKQIFFQEIMVESYKEVKEIKGIFRVINFWLK